MKTLLATLLLLALPAQGQSNPPLDPEGFLDVAADSAWGRPVDVLVMPDGALLVSDDQANAIYRISYKRPG